MYFSLPLFLIYGPYIHCAWGEWAICPTHVMVLYFNSSTEFQNINFTQQRLAVVQLVNKFPAF